MARARLAGIAAVAIALLPAAADAAPVFLSHVARVEVAVSGVSQASVTETYELDAPAEDARFEFLQQPCSDVGAIEFFSGDRPLAATSSQNGPWTMLHVAGSSRDLHPIHVRYNVRLGDGGTVPIVLPSSTMASVPQLRGADVSLSVTFSGALQDASVVLPRLGRDRDGAWRARMLAMPSVVSIRLPGVSRSCERTLAGTTGGLEYRFWIFVGTMAVWIPVYFWWFSRPDATA